MREGGYSLKSECNRTEKRGVLCREGGFSLVEVLIAMTILALISIPLMKYFSDSLRHSSLMATKQKATALCQQKVEELKAVDSLIELVTVGEGAAATEEYSIPYLTAQNFGVIDYTGMGDPSAESFKSTGKGMIKLQYEHPADPAAENQLYKNYDVYVKLSTNVAANEVEHPVIYGIDDTKDMLAVEREQMEEVVMRFWALNNAYVMNKRTEELAKLPGGGIPTPDPAGGDPVDPFPWLKTMEKDDIRKNIVRKIHIEVDTLEPTPGDIYYTARVYYTYICEKLYPKNENPDENEPSEELVSSDLANIKTRTLSSLYLLYDINMVTVTHDDGTTTDVIVDDEIVMVLPTGCEPELVLVCQNLAGLEASPAYSGYTMKVWQDSAYGVSLWPVKIRTNIASGSLHTKDDGAYAVGSGEDATVKPLTDVSTTVQVLEMEVSICPRGGDIADAYTTVKTTKGE